MYVWLTAPIFQTPQIIDYEQHSEKKQVASSSQPTTAEDSTKSSPIETCRWFNLALGIILREQFNSPTFRAIYKHKIEKEIKEAKKPDFIVQNRNQTSLNSCNFLGRHYFS